MEDVVADAEYKASGRQPQLNDRFSHRFFVLNVRNNWMAAFGAPMSADCLTLCPRMDGEANLQAFNILKKIPDDTRRKLAARGYIAQSGYVMKYLPVPPNCLYNPEFTDGQSLKSNAISISLFGKILEKIEKTKESASGSPNFESYDTESTELQFSIGQYIQARGTTKVPQGAKRFAASTDSSHSSTKEWLEKMKTLFISKVSPSTHKHSLQALNSQSAKIEALELFSVEKQLSSSHSGRLNLQLTNDSLLALKLMSSRTMLSKESANQLAMLLSLSLNAPAVIQPKPCCTITKIIQSALPAELTCEGDSTVIKLDLEKESVQASFSDLVSSIICVKGPGDALKFLNALQPLFMEFLLLDGFSLTLQDFSVPKLLLEGAQECIKEQSSVFEQSRRCFKSHSVDYNLKNIKEKISNFVVKSSRLGLLVDPKSDPSMSKVVQQLGFVGLQLYHEGKLYSGRLVESCFSNFVNRHPPIGEGIQHAPEAYGLVQSSYFHGLNPYEELVHAISTRETIVRSSRGLPEAGTLFKGLMAILRDVVVCYDGTVRNICSNSIMQLKYKEDPSAITPGEPVGALAATAISNPAYKSVLDASQSNNTSWELMKEILQTKVSYKNDAKNRKVILFLNDCSCPKKFCKEKAAIAVQGCLKRVTLEDCTTDICIEYQKQVSLKGTSEATPAFVGHIHLEKEHLEQINVSTDDILWKCQEVSGKHGNKKGTLGLLFKKISFSTW
nr:DNA-directed RNA polymerase V subunit 1-like [Aegilops tauschii subsp. strangulata]